MRICWRIQHQLNSTVIQHLKQIGKVKKLNKYVPENQKIINLEYCLLLFYSTKNISQSDCDMWQKVDFIQLAMTSSVVGLWRSSKAFPKGKLVAEKKNKQTKQNKKNSSANYHFFKHLYNFCRENDSTTSRRQKMLSKISSNLEAQTFML